MTPACVEFVITEHPPAITAARAGHYEQLRQRLEGLAGVTVRSRRYDDPTDLEDAAAVVLSGSFEPWSVHSSRSLASLGDRVMRYAGPVLGICAGMQLQVMFAGGAVEPRTKPDVGFGMVELLRADPLFDGLGPAPVVYEHHAEDVTTVPEEFEVLARSPGCAVEAIAVPHRRWWGTQFHPECFSDKHPDGARVLANFFARAGLGARREMGVRTPSPEAGWHRGSGARRAPAKARSPRAP